ncbi:MAG: MFS transporter, partial [Lacisediminihabitans sp.]
GSIGLVLFGARQFWLQRANIALLDLRTFRAPTFSFSIVMIAISMLTMFGTIILLPLYTQNVLGLSVLDTGLLLLPGGLLMGMLAPFVGRLYDRFGPIPLVVPGAIIVSGVMWSFTFLGEYTSFWWVLAGHVSLSFGFALLFTPLFTAGLAALKPDLYSHGSAIVSAIQQVGGAVGTALFISVITAGASTLLTGGASLPAAFAAGIHSAFIYGAAISLLGIPVAFFIRKPAHATNEFTSVH